MILSDSSVASSTMETLVFQETKELVSKIYRTHDRQFANLMVDFFPSQASKIAHMASNNRFFW